MRFNKAQSSRYQVKELIAERAALGVFAALPGITGLAQVQGIDMLTPNMIENGASGAVFFGNYAVLDLEVVHSNVCSNGCSFGHAFNEGAVCGKSQVLSDNYGGRSSDNYLGRLI